MKKFYIFAGVVILFIVLYKFYIVAYNLGRNYKFFCKITFGNWVDETKTYELGNGLKLQSVRGCHTKSDELPALR